MDVLTFLKNSKAGSFYAVSLGSGQSGIISKKRNDVYNFNQYKGLDVRTLVKIISLLGKDL